MSPKKCPSGHDMVRFDTGNCKADWCSECSKWYTTNGSEIIVIGDCDDSPLSMVYRLIDEAMGVF